MAKAGNEEHVTRFVIDRKIWARGLHPRQKANTLHGLNRKMCCLGVYLHACGVPKKSMTLLATPRDLPLRDIDIPRTAQWLLSKQLTTHSNGPANSRTTNALVRANDGHMNERAREAAVRRLFAKHGIKVTFKG